MYNKCTMNKIKVAAAQTNPALMQNEENLAGITGTAREAAQNGAQLVVFPECSLTGYIFQSRDEALPYAETVPGPATVEVEALCKELGIHIAFGLLEKDGDRLFNAAALIGPDGLIGSYRKNHLPFMGVDRFTDRGDRPFQVYSTPIGKIGLFICYDVMFPESARVMALMGADILVLLTNFPSGRGEIITDHLVSARAIENNVHVVSANRVGTERDGSFSGMSKIVDASWETLALAGPDTAEIIYADIDPAAARQKRTVAVPGVHEVDCMKDRRPELYDTIRSTI